MKLRKLDNIKMENNKICYLCSTSLYDYLDGLDDDFYNYEIQRKIVSNRYLDNLAETVLSNEHIPIITLVSEDKILEGNQNELEAKKIQILDGLQRTWRLNAIKKLADWLKKEYKTDKNIEEQFIKASAKSISREKRIEILGFGVSDFRQAKNIAQLIVDKVGIDKVDSCLKTSIQWFELWVGLSKEDIVNKMLLLNAGHKSVSMRHQIELLYYGWFEVFSNGTNILLVRDKDAPSPVSFVENRKMKQYRFSDLVLATIAFMNGDYMSIQSEVVEKKFLKNSYFERLGDQANDYKSIIKCIGNCDEIISSKFGNEGTKWFGRENCLEAFMGVIGKIYKEDYSTESVFHALEQIYNIVEERVQYFNLQEFENGKKKLNSSKINIGQTTKKIIFSSILNVLCSDKPENINWEREFGNVRL